MRLKSFRLVTNVLDKEKKDGNELLSHCNWRPTKLKRGWKDWYLTLYRVGWKGSICLFKDSYFVFEVPWSGTDSFNSPGSWEEPETSARVPAGTGQGRARTLPANSTCWPRGWALPTLPIRCPDGESLLKFIQGRKWRPK